MFTGDTEPCEATVAVAQGAELLVHDGTFADEEAERAAPDRPLDRAPGRRGRARGGRRRCSRSRICRSRYFAPAIEKEAREVFERTVVPRDFDVIEVPYRERGEPQLMSWKDWRERNREPGGAGPAGVLRARVRRHRLPLLHSPRRFL